VCEWDTKPSATVPGLSDAPVLDRRFRSSVPARLRPSLARSGCRNALDSGYNGISLQADQTTWIYCD
jgi:hypothetical protein